MKVKLKVAILAMMVLFCSVSSVESNAAVSTKTIDVPSYGTYCIHGIYNKSVTNKYVYVTNLVDYGKYAYCYIMVTANLSGDYINMMVEQQKLNKDGRQKTFILSNTVDAGKKICLKVTGVEGQVGKDQHRITFVY